MQKKNNKIRNRCCLFIEIQFSSALKADMMQFAHITHLNNCIFYDHEHVFNQRTQTIETLT